MARGEGKRGKAGKGKREVQTGTEIGSPKNSSVFKNGS